MGPHFIEAMSMRRGLTRLAVTKTFVEGELLRRMLGATLWWCLAIRKEVKLPRAWLPRCHERLRRDVTAPSRNDSEFRAHSSVAISRGSLDR